MSNNLLATWSSNHDEGLFSTVLPDGCRDIILKTTEPEKPICFVSPLFDTPETVYVEVNTRFQGLRLKPGVEVKENDLLDYFHSKDVAASELEEVLDDFTSLSPAIDEALACLASDVDSVKQASGRLGVSTRTLQRLILNKTQRTPGYWFQLARIRKAAKSLHSADSLSCVADRHGFSDQSHMNREFQRWLNATPTQLLNTPELIEQLKGKGYG